MVKAWAKLVSEGRVTTILKYFENRDNRIYLLMVQMWHVRKNVEDDSKETEKMKSRWIRGSVLDKFILKCLLDIKVRDVR